MQNEKTSFFKSFLGGLRTEYNKIIFPTRQDVVKQSAAVIIASFLIGGLIAALDLVMKTGLGYILK
ncbi:preprotein translocase subunit SecE [Oribacterium sp. oral taxon 102]|uniref:preprotein translocase subunit SecE n=1 Tax=Oribacterium sp. oral taxon 102 TaxID=671214 RepID=UPI0015BEB733|nr:preprotein translocase subunit SecE [Oribacterium sp. oral taxon 102]NWO22211.1 preprotein translocase subunit SecE [Oribacterium sp. oral taxon 102]